MVKIDDLSKLCKTRTMVNGTLTPQWLSTGLAVEMTVFRALLRACRKIPAQPALPAWGALGTQLVTGLFAAADTADQGVTGFFSKLLSREGFGQPWKASPHQ
jgi:hypothetical protein